MVTVPQATLTLEQFAQLPGDDARHEMDAGTLITLPPAKSLHSRIARSVFIAIQACLDKAGLREAFSEAGYVLSQEPLTIRQPDISVLGKDRIAATDADSYFQGAPDLAVEIVSPSDSAQDLESKVKQYLQAGAKQVWVLYPKTRNIYVFSGTQSPRILEENQTLEGGELLPGFSVKVADLFAV
jgi:Uma2 family endonuclease